MQKIAKTLKETHKLWLADPGRHGRPHKDTEMRRLLPDYSVTIRTLTSAQKKRYGAGWMESYSEKWNVFGGEDIVDTNF